MDSLIVLKFILRSQKCQRFYFKNLPVLICHRTSQASGFRLINFSPIMQSNQRDNNYYRTTSTAGALFTANSRHYCRVTVSDLDKKLNLTSAEKKKSKTVQVEKIFLISESNDISEVTLLEAEKISKKRGLQLVKVDDTKGRLHTDKKVYQLMSNSQFFGEDWRSRTKKKSQDSEAQSGAKEKDKQKEDKSLVIKSKITQHDLTNKIKNIKKLVHKGYSVRIFIEDVTGAGGSLEAAEGVYTIMEENLKESSRFVQKRTKGSEIRFQIIPPKVDESSTSTSAPITTSKDKIVEHDNT